MLWSVLEPVYINYTGLYLLPLTATQELIYQQRYYKEGITEIVRVGEMFPCRGPEEQVEPTFEDTRLCEARKLSPITPFLCRFLSKVPAPEQVALSAQLVLVFLMSGTKCTSSLGVNTLLNWVSVCFTESSDGSNTQHVMRPLNRPWAYRCWGVHCCG